METTARNASLADLRDLLVDQHARKLDLVVPANKLSLDADGTLVVQDADPVIDEHGVTSVEGRFRPLDVFDDGLSGKLNIPRAYVRRLRNERPDLLQANVNGLLHGQPGLYTPDGRKFLVRLFSGDVEGNPGVARALLSDSYRIVDNFDVLTAALEGVRDAGVPVNVSGADLSDRRMYVKVESPAVAELAPDLLRGYRSPFSGNEGSDNPTVFAGFVISNSETGGGAFTITPRIVVEICSNGMTLQKDALRSIHLGAKQNEGVVEWSDETQRRNLDLVTSQAKDAVSTFLDPDYLRAKIGQLSEHAQERVTVEEVQTITKTLSYDAQRTESVLDFFVQGGQLTRGGVTQAITAAAQHVQDADQANEMEAEAASLLLS